MPLFNHSLEGVCSWDVLDTIPGVRQYSARALCMTSPRDTIQLDPELKSQLPFVMRHYRRAGLPVTERVIWDIELGIANSGDHRNSPWEVFLFSPAHHAVRPDEAWMRAVMELNHKNHFLRFCKQHRVPTPETRFFDGGRTALNGTASELAYPVFAKLALSASGAGISRVESADALARWLDGIGNEPFQLQAEVPNAIFASVQYLVSGKRAQRMAETEQVLEGFAHSGNRVPTSTSPASVCDSLAQQVAVMGFKGRFGFDVAIPQAGGPLVVECNPRITAAVYPMTVAERLRADCWLSATFPVKAASLDEIEFAGTEYNRETREGVVLVSWGVIVAKKISVVALAESPERCDELMKRFREANYEAH